MPKIVITGSSGLVGGICVRAFQQAGWEVVCLQVRRSTLAHIDLSPCEGAQVWAHFGGVDIAQKRWSESRKKLLWESRVQTSQELVQHALAHLKEPPKLWIAASAIGYYGCTHTESAREDSPAGQDYLAQMCVAWEKAWTDHLAPEALALLRLGVVLSPRGGALPKLLRAAQWGLLGTIGRGQQAFSWIGEQDLAQLLLWIAQNHGWGVWNAVAESLPQAQFAQLIRKHQKMPLGIPVPEFVLRILLGEMSMLFTQGTQAQAYRAQREGLQWKCPDLETYLSQELNAL